MAKAPKIDGAADETAPETDPPSDDVQAEVDASKAFHDEFVANLPPGAETGTYHATAHDGFAGRVFAGLHGVVVFGEWAFKFVEGRFEEALHRHRAKLAGVEDAPVDGEKPSVG